jgi:hypothetical protein
VLHGEGPDSHAAADMRGVRAVTTSGAVGCARQCHSTWPSGEQQ